MGSVVTQYSLLTSKMVVTLGTLASKCPSPSSLLGRMSPLHPDHLTITGLDGSDQCVPGEADGDAALIAKALGDLARAQGIAQVARDSGLSRESLYKAFSGERSPSFDTILKVVTACV